jgi:hypothetical protein
MSERKGKPKGRPPEYSAEIGAEICTRIAEGESLRQICKAPGMPAKTTVFRWLADERRITFRDQYARAREAQMETLAEEILEIADGTVADNAAVALARVRIDSRKWLMSKLAPKKYGDKLDLSVDGGPIKTMNVSEVEREINDLFAPPAGKSDKRGTMVHRETNGRPSLGRGAFS